MSSRKNLMLAVCAATAVGSAHTQNGSTQAELIRYDFTMVVRENLFDNNNGPLAELQVGQIGQFSITLLDDKDLFADFSTETAQAYSIEEVALQIGSITSAGDPDHVPSTGFLDTFMLSNNARASSHPQAAISDGMGAIINLDNPILGFTVFSITQQTPFDSEPTIFSSLDLPREPFDLSLITSENHFVIQDPADGFQRVNFRFTNVEVTVIPTPMSAGLFALTGLAAMRRRR
ncbi:MAG: hypothetical protein ACIAQ0_05505 [Phycisphaerales bacterium JB058]